MAKKKFKKLSELSTELGQVVYGCRHFKKHVGELFWEDLDKNLEKKESNKDRSLLND